MTIRCDNGTICGPGGDSADSRVYLRSDCKKLTCERCGPFRAKKYRKAIGRIAEERNLTRFLTLTLDPKKLEPGEESIAYIRKCFAKFRVYLGRRFKGSITFISVVELHKSGTAHLHILVGRYIDQGWIKKSWQAVGGGYKVDIRLVDVHRINAYLSKYVTKAILTSVPAHKKRISTSRDICINPKKEKQEGWNYSLESIDVMWGLVNDPGNKVYAHRFDSEGVLLEFRVEWPAAGLETVEPYQEEKEQCLINSSMLYSEEDSISIRRGQKSWNFLQE
jgi:hypothetical protein